MHLIHDPAAAPAPETTFDTFLAADIRAGTILSADAFPEARNPSYRLIIDLGPGVGTKKSIARITENYALEDLPGKRVMAVVNFPSRQIGPARSETLLLGFADDHGHIVLSEPAAAVPNGARLA
ncbi:tRNA-binding protein [Altericroceibacterium endophyticum]|uniref:tRNA-binding protein n=1 Tax=Altericroceibacterium endophyticum TaxID=1808508 RepID=A0A6I4T6T2_9SPHN|nr:tRNA-binding protein [Altericroceibacterium endophyticum]MXO65535.1 tRNA-binding protein [Altericroceibacterium endophyticum]